ncbi:MAG: NINE protein [Lachnospiraceae bacterium]|nr:NINE protein [Lachnospiraceae bacterium]
MEKVDYRCPYCGAKIELDPADTEWFCGYCDSRIIPESDVLQKIRYERRRGGFGGTGHTERERQWRSDGYYDIPKSRQKPAEDPENVSGRSRLLALLLALFLGELGVHRFYAGKIGTGILYAMTAGLFGMGIIYDIIMIVLGRFCDRDGLPLLRWDI